MGKRKKKDSGESISMDSFLDILTCLVGVLVLIIILTSIDASQTKVLVTTPKLTKTDKKLLFIECRENKLYPIDLRSIRETVETKLAEIDATLPMDASQDEKKKAIAEASYETANYVIDPSYVLVGSLALTPRAGEGEGGDDLTGVNIQELEGMVVPGWYGKMLEEINPDTDLLTFIVRDDSFKVFKKARAIAWQYKLQVAYELMAVNDSIIFGLGGDIALAQ